jgi:hypothetical protein
VTDPWDELQNRKPQPTATVPLPLDPTAYQAAEDELEDARRALLDAQRRGDVLEPFQSRVEAAEKALDEQPCTVFTVHAIPPKRWDELSAQHQPTAEQRQQGWQWNIPTFRPALLAEAAEPKFEPERWVVLAATGKIAPGELDTLFAQAVRASNRIPRVDVGKG